MQQEMDRFLDAQARMRGIPINVGFELTPLCNFDCKMCYVHLTKEQMAKEGTVLTTEQWLRIMEQAVKAGMLHADLTGGECLTHPGFKTLYLYLQSQGVKVSVLTNGALITEEMADFFAQHPPVVVQITVYGSSEEDYERVTGHRAFADVRAAIERLKKRNVRLMLTVTLSRYTQKDYHALLEFLRETNVEYGVGGVALPAREDTGRRFEDYAPDLEMWTQMQLDEKKRAETLAGHVETPPAKQIERLPRNFKRISRIPCASGQSTCHINWKGEMQPCISFHTITRSVLAYGYADAWEWIKSAISKFEPPEECRDCKMLSLCKTCSAEKTSGVLNGPVNRAVCQRYAYYLDAGIVSLPNRKQCP
jgi:radical SAM protein with 4Fe4S-binding SPASM domain